MNYIVRTIIFGGPIVITFIDNVGYIARVDGKNMENVLWATFKKI